MCIVFLATHERVIFICVANRPINIVHARPDGGLERTRKSRWCDPDKPKGSHRPHLVHINDFEEELKKVDDDDGIKIMTELRALYPNIRVLLLSSYLPHISQIGHSVVGAATRSPPR